MANPNMDPLSWLRNQLETADTDLLKEMVTSFANQLMSAEVDALCGAGYGERTADRENSRNGYRARDWDTRAGSLDLAIPKLRTGTYFPDWLLAGAAPASGAGDGGGGGRVLSARGQHPAGRGPGQDVGD